MKSPFIESLVALSFATLAIMNSATSARADAPPIYGEWVTTEATATLYAEDRTVDYAHCTLHFRFFPTDSSERRIRIEALSGRCVSSKYYDFSPIYTPGTLEVGQRSGDGFKVKIDADGAFDSFEVRRVGNGISLDWSERSFDGLNFDLSTGPMAPARLRRRTR